MGSSSFITASPICAKILKPMYGQIHYIVRNKEVPMEKSSTSPPLRAVGYRRVSMKDQVEGFSLDAQEGNITRYVEAHGWELIDIYIDAGISAKKGSRRPAFERLMKEAQAGKFDV